MKTTKRLLAFLLVAVMALSLFTACGRKGAGDDGDVVTLVVRTRNSGANKDFDRVMAYVNELLEEKINVHIDLQLYSNTKEMNTQNDLDMAAGDPIDLIWMNMGTYTSYVNEEGLLPLNDLLEEYAPDLKGSIREAYWNALEVDGEIYAVPNQQIAVSQKAILVQKSLADEFGKFPEHVNSVEDVVPFIEWMIENHPELYPVYNSTMNIFYSQPENVFENVSGAAMLRVNYDDPTKVMYDVWEFAYKPVGYMYQEIQDRWIRPDMGTGVDESADLAAAKYAILFDTNRPGIEAEYASKYGVEWLRVPVGNAYTTSTSLTSTLFGIPWTSEHPEKAVELLNLLHTDKEVFNALMYGIEGVHYNKVSENKVAVVENSGWDGYTSAWAFGNSFLAYAYGNQPENLAELTIAINESATLSPIDGFKFDPAGWESVIANVSAIKSEYHTSWFYGDAASRYDAYMQKLEDADLDGLIEAVQEQLDAYWAEKNK